MCDYPRQECLARQGDSGRSTDSEGGDSVTGQVSLQEWIVAIAEVGAGLFVAVILRTALRRLAARARSTERRGDDMLVALSSLLPWAAAIGGVWGAVLTLPLGSGWRSDADRGKTRRGSLGWNPRRA